MFICGKGYAGGKNACALTPTSVNEITYAELKNGIYDYLYITKAADISVNDEPPADWDSFDIILYAKFNGSTHAGNIDQSAEETTHLAVKRRALDTFLWQTLAVKEVHTIDDFTFYYNDYSVPSGQPTEYAIVPVYYGIEGRYSTAHVTPKFDMMFLIEGDTVYGTPITDGFCDTTRNIPSANLELLNRKYPIFVSNTIADYNTGQCTGSFVRINEDTCDAEMDIRYDYSRITYQKEIMDFLSDRSPKILKLPDGRIWLVQIAQNPTDTADQYYNNRKISFSWVEIGDVNSEEDLYYLGLSDISPEWWNH